MNNNKSVLARFFSHNITLLVLSFIIAFTAWFIINMSSETETSVTISDIPVTIELTDDAVDDGLKIFNGQNITASVEVSGNRVTVGSLSTADIQIVANQSSSIIAPGTYTLSLSAKKTGLKTNYSFVSSVTPANITVFVDREKEQEFDLENHISIQLEDNSHYASTSLSQNKITVTGPETQVSQISSVAVSDNITSVTDDSQTLQEKVAYLDEDGKELELPLVVPDVETVEVTVTVLPVANITLDVATSGEPKNCPEITISPDEIKLAGPQNILDGIEDNCMILGNLDFSKLKNESYNLTFDIPVSSGCKVISGESSSKVSIDLSDYSRTTLTCKVTGNIDSSAYTTEFATNNVTITLYGPEELIDEITDSDVTAIANFDDMLDDVTGTNAVSLSVPIDISLASDYQECWVFGSYTANVNVSKK